MPSFTNRLFPLPPAQQAAAESWFERGEGTPRKPRAASSVLLLRDSREGAEVFLRYRRGESPLGKIAFPGGSLEETDGDQVPWFGPTPSEWAKALGMDDHQQAMRHVVAAIRELFEETGILLAGPDASTLLESNRGPEWMEAREGIASGEKSFPALLARRGLGLRTDLLRPLSHWKTADFALRRFDTYYFAAVQPLGQESSLLQGRGIWGKWCIAVHEFERRQTTALGDEVGQPDTVGLTLEQLTVPSVQLMLEKLAKAKGCIAYLAHRRPNTVHQPELVKDDDGVYLLRVSGNDAAEGAGQRGR
ncbi:NUDIX hydrolase [Arthrobacter caoxuetaonis]|uniref:NUDIX hydrolase n=1 Tax=Arthrobacter caoxuetaonis TaxID=2886935 RepID=UPI001D13ECD5|nr:NUDIX hydrolase [Arthrobacter caoxuetaonis]MCC3281423.1 NUDIX hydrolase [Arthrobacter caoxuetaonis]